MFTGVLVTVSNGQIFTGELEIMYRGQYDYWRGTVSWWKLFLKFFSGVRLFVADVSVVRRFVPGRFTACPETGLAPIFSPRRSTGYSGPGHLDGGVPGLQ